MESAEKFRVGELLQEQEAPTNKFQPTKATPYFSKNEFYKFLMLHYKAYALAILIFITVGSGYLAYHTWADKDCSLLKVQFTEEFDNKWQIAFDQKDAISILNKSANITPGQSFILNKNGTYEILLDQKDKDINQMIITLEKESPKIEQAVSKNLDAKIASLKSNLDLIKKDITDAIPITSKNYYKEKTQNEIKQFIQYGNQWNELRHQYFQQVLKIEEVARHNTVNVFKLKEKDIHSPLDDEYKMLKKTVIDINDPDIQLKFESLKAEHEKYLNKILLKELDELEEAELNPARRLLVEEEKKLRSLWFEMETIKGLYLQSKQEIDKNNASLLYEEQLKHMLASAKSLMVNIENTMQAKYMPSKVWGKIELERLKTNALGLPTLSAGYLLLTLLTIAILLQYRQYIKSPRIHSLTSLQKQIGKHVHFHFNEHLLQSITEENAKYFEYIKQNALFFQRIDRHCGVILINTLDPKATSFWSKLIASTGANVCWLVQKELESLPLKEFALHKTMQQGLSAYLNKKSQLSNAVYATDFQNLFISPMDAKSRLPQSEDFSNLKATMNEKFDYLVVNCHPNQLKKHYQYFSEQVEYQINCVFEDQTLTTDLHLNMEEKHPNTQILNAYIAKDLSTV